jgi:hypothetical protein
MNDFFPMSRGDLLFICVLVLISFVSFLPWSRSVAWGGMAAQGWMMAFLMVVSPSIALFRLVTARHDSEAPES